MIACSLCLHQINEQDPLAERMKKRHEERHQRGRNHKKQENGGGNNIIGKVEWRTVGCLIEIMTLEERIIDHLSSWVNGLSFVKLLNALNVNADYKPISRSTLMETLRVMVDKKSIRKQSNGSWIDIRGKHGRYGNKKGAYTYSRQKNRLAKREVTACQKESQ